MSLAKHEITHRDPQNIFKNLNCSLERRGAYQNISSCLCPCFFSVFRLLSQLDETERAFDEFWVRHQTKLEQCLQLRHFEHNYREVSWFLLAQSAQVKSSLWNPKSDPRIPAAGEDSVGAGVRETSDLLWGRNQPSLRWSYLCWAHRLWGESQRKYTETVWCHRVPDNTSLNHIFLIRLISKLLSAINYEQMVFKKFFCWSTGGAGQSGVVGPGGWGPHSEVPLCSGLHSAQMHRDQHNQWGCEGQSEGQEGPTPQSHEAASRFGKGKSRTCTTVVVWYICYCKGSAALPRLPNGWMMGSTCWRLNQ